MAPPKGKNQKSNRAKEGRNLKKVPLNHSLTRKESEIGEASNAHERGRKGKTSGNLKGKTKISPK